MNCRRAKKLVFDFLDGLISDTDRLALESHLGECSTCEAMAAGLTKSLDLLHRLPPVELDENFNWKVRLRLAREKNAAARSVDTHHTWARSWNRRFVFSALSTFVVAIAIAYVAMNASLTPGNFVSGPVATAEDEPRQNKPVNSPNEDLAKRENQADAPGRSGRSGVMPDLVSSSNDDSDGGLDNGPLKEDRPSLNVDSLRVEFLKSAAVHSRVQRLQRQIEILQIELRECEIDSK